MSIFAGLMDRLEGRLRLLVLFGVLLSTAGVLLGLELSGTKSQAMALLRDPLSVLDQRSPGARPGGALLQTKLRREAAERHQGSPSERVLTSMRTRPAEPSFGLADVLPEELAGGVLPVDGDQTPAAVDVSLLPSFFIPSIVGGVAGIGGSGGGAGGGTGGGLDAPPTIVTPPAAAVPEPATWLSMILGFGLAGAAMRRPRRPGDVRRQMASGASG